MRLAETGLHPPPPLFLSAQIGDQEFWRPNESNAFFPIPLLRKPFSPRVAFIFDKPWFIALF